MTAALMKTVDVALVAAEDNDVEAPGSAALMVAVDND